jgi:adenylate cyclase
MFEKVLQDGDQITIGASKLDFTEIVEIEEEKPEEIPQVPTDKLKYDDNPLGHTQLLISASEIIGKHSNISIETNLATPEEIKELRRKAQVLDLLYELSKTLGTVFDLKEIFVKATDLIFRGTPAERVVALIAEENSDGSVSEYTLYPIAARTRDAELEGLTEKLSISRTITQKVMREKVALLSQDARADAQFSASESIVSQGVRSTICAPLLTESSVHGVVYADRFDPFAAFSSSDLELISAVAAQTAMVVETVKAHKRLAREEVARANYSRFMPEYVVKQLLDNPDSFRLGGITQTITVLFADIRGFTTLSESENPVKIVGLLNRYFSAMSDIIFAHGGTLDKYIGDGLMAIFGAPTVTPNDAKNALETAVDMQRRLVALNNELQAEGYSSIGVGIGLHTGDATVGYIGSDKRSEYTAIGDTVNLAARLEQNAKPGQILISEATVRLCNGADLVSFIPHKPLTVKNRLQPVSLFEVKWN